MHLTTEVDYDDFDFDRSIRDRIRENDTKCNFTGVGENILANGCQCLS